MTTPRQLHIGIAQLPAWFGDIAGQLEYLTHLLHGRRVDLVLLPELGLTGYVTSVMTFDLAALAEPADGPTMDACARLARHYRTALAVPLLESVASGQLYNSLLLFNAHGERIGHWRKRHPWYPETWATPGDLGTPLVQLNDITLCAAICFDIHFVGKEAAAELDAADLLLFPSAWVERPDSRPQHLAALAREHRVAIANANWGLGTPAIYGQGHSMILNTTGTVVASTPLESELGWCEAVLGFGPA